MCDNEWHHYAVSVNFPTAELTVDGDRFVASFELRRYFVRQAFRARRNCRCSTKLSLVFLFRWEPEGTENPEIIDDWPLHQVSGLSTKVTVGACWQGISVKAPDPFR